jgi:hypothetical protein
MDLINRCVLIVKAKEPFLEWVRRLPDPERSMTLSQLNEDSHAYLLPEYEMDEDREALLAECYDDIFYHELMGWWTDESAYPASRSLEMFKEWFSVEFHSSVVDLGDTDLETEAFDA